MKGTGFEPVFIKHSMSLMIYFIIATTCIPKLTCSSHSAVHLNRPFQSLSVYQFRHPFNILKRRRQDSIPAMIVMGIEPMCSLTRSLILN